MSENEHLPPIVPPPAATFRHRLHNGSTHAVHLNNHTTMATTSRSPPASPKKYVTKTANTTTTMKKSIKGGPVMQNGSQTHFNRTDSGDRNRKVNSEHKFFSFRKSNISLWILGSEILVVTTTI